MEKEKGKRWVARERPFARLQIKHLNHHPVELQIARLVETRMAWEKNFSMFEIEKEKGIDR